MVELSHLSKEGIFDYMRVSQFSEILVGSGVGEYFGKIMGGAECYKKIKDILS